MSSLLLVGCGKMGSALLTRWRAHPSALFSDFRVIDPVASSIAGVVTVKSIDDLPDDYMPGAIVFAVKPQQLEEILPAFRTRFGDAPLYMSIAAGKTLAFFARHLGDSARVVRAMPNTPALVGCAVTVLCATAGLQAADKQRAVTLMQAVGSSIWLEDESWMDAVTALSGSGPAYVFLFLGALTNAGVAAGLPEALARILALETLMGSCALAQSSQENFEQLCKNVTSPGGTTEAALGILMQGDALAKLVQEAVAAAKKRSQELAE